MKRFGASLLAACLAALVLLPASAGAANINVTTTTDVIADDDQCSIREALNTAESNTPVGPGGMGPDCVTGQDPSTDFVLLTAGTYNLVGTGEDLNAFGDLDITNEGDTVTIDGVANGAGVPQTVIQAPPMDRILEIHDPGVTDASEVNVQDVILQGGNPQGAGVDGGAIYVEDDQAQMTVGQARIQNNTAPHYGGGIAFPNGSDLGPDLKLRQVEFSGNSAGDEGGGVYYGLSGAAPPTDFPLVIERSAFVGNSAADVGGGVYIEGTNSIETLEVFNSTFSGNSATNGGGAVSLGGISASADFRFTTIAQNTSTTAGRAGGIQTDSNAHLIEFLGTIIAGNTALNCAEVAPGDLTFVANTVDYNIESANTCDLDPVTRGGGGTDLINTDPLLAPLATNAGPIQTSRTHGLYDTSPALNRIPRSPDNWCTSVNTNGETDQRSSPRPTAPTGFCDVGAFEGSVGPVPVTTPPVTPVVPDPTTAKKKKCKKKKKKKRSAAAAKKCKKKKKK